LKSIDDKVLIMGSNLHAGSMQQSRQPFRADSLFNENFGEKVSPVGLLSQQGTDNKRDERDREW
jgi:hypothetical protein